MINNMNYELFCHSMAIFQESERQYQILAGLCKSDIDGGPTEFYDLELKRWRLILEGNEEAYAFICSYAFAYANKYTDKELNYEYNDNHCNFVGKVCQFDVPICEEESLFEAWTYLNTICQ